MAYLVIALGFALAGGIVGKLKGSSFFLWFVIGVVVYAAYGYSHSRLGRGEAIEANPEAEL